MRRISEVARLLSCFLLMSATLAGGDASSGKSPQHLDRTRQELLQAKESLRTVNSRIRELDAVRPKPDETVEELLQLKLQSRELGAKVSSLEASVKALGQAEERKRELYAALKKQQFQEEYAVYSAALRDDGIPESKKLADYRALCERWRVPHGGHEARSFGLG